MFDKFSSSGRATLRFTLAMTFAIALTAMFDWTLDYIMPVLLAKFLVGKQAPTWHTVYELMLGMLCLVAIAGVASLGLNQYPFPMLLTIALVMFWSYYAFIDPKWNFLATLTLFGIVVIPFFGEGYSNQSLLVALSIAASGAIAILLFVLVNILIPHQSKHSEEKAELLPTQERIKESARALVIAFPIVCIIYWFGTKDHLLFMIFVTLLSLQATVEKSTKVSIYLIFTNSLGGLFALAALTLVSLNPSIEFYVLLTGTLCFIAAQKIFSPSAKVAIYTGVFDAFLVILLSVAQSPEGDFAASFYQRIIQIFVVSIYMIVAAAVMDLYMAKKSLTEGKPLTFENN